MIPKECKRLAEVDFPIAAVSRCAPTEKYGAKGYPSTLHLWWARRPLAACRAMLMALLLPDPTDPNCPEEFRRRARNLLPRVVGSIGPTGLDLRQSLLQFIADFANWDKSSDATFLEVARGLVRAAHGEEPPLVVDPFAGGGSIPLEALRLGCDAFASDLNPVACLILKTMLEDIPCHGPGLADELRKAGAQIKAAAEKELRPFYPPDPDGAEPIAYLWARIINCDHCGCQIPLVRSLWLCKKPSRKRALRFQATRPKHGPPLVDFEIFEPKSESDIQPGTVSRAKATCPACRLVTPPDRVRAQLRDQRGGADVIFDANGNRTGGARLLAVVTLRPGQSGRNYRLPTDRDYAAVRAAAARLQVVAANPLPGGLSPIPDEPLPPQGTLGFRVQLYGMARWGDLFTARQKLATLQLAGQIKNIDEAATTTALAMALDRVAMSGMSLTRWNATAEKMQHTFGRQALPIVWNFTEVVPTAACPGNWTSGFELVADVVVSVASAIKNPGTAHLADACEHPLTPESAMVWFTDPPYYDAIPYADLSDFFFVWLKRSLPGHPLMGDPFDAENPLTPKEREAIEDPAKATAGRAKDRLFFENAIARSFSEGRRTLTNDGIACVVFAHKTTEGWEALISGLVRAGWVVTASWPIETEMETRQRARDSAALATSVHLVCRPRPADAPVGDWADVVRELPVRVGDWIERLQSEGVRGADLVFACIGPAMEIYSRYSKVEDAEGNEIPLGGNPDAAAPHQRGFLAYVWETIGRLALQNILGTAEARARNGAADALEEDARLTALFLWALRSTDNGPGPAAASDDEDETDEDEGPAPKKKRGLTLIYDVVRRFAQPLGIHLEKWEGRIIETEKGVVRLISVAERKRNLFGEADAAAISHRIERDVKANLNYTFAFMQEAEPPPPIKPRSFRRAKSDAGKADAPSRQAPTTLDRVHAAMLLQAGGQANGLRALLKEEIQRGPDFLRLANALSALYPKESDEKRLLDAMLLAAPRYAAATG